MRRLTVMLLSGLCVAAQAQNFSSGPDATPVIELYTSQGCSSCPPAERWLSSLSDRAGLWSDFIPMAWHVDYWDGLGWPDVYSAAEFTARQRQYHQVGRVQSVYTPAVLRDGVEWRRWRLGGGLGAKQRSDVGHLKMRLEHSQAHIAFRPGKHLPSHQTLSVHVALLGSGIQTAVERGENRGRNLRQDFVVLAHASNRLDAGQATFAVPRRDELDSPRRAMVAWVSAGDDPAPLQAVGGWYDERQHQKPAPTKKPVFD